MVRSQLVNRIAEDHSISSEQASKALYALFNTIIEGLENGDRIELRGFGVFCTHLRDAKVGRNPRTGEAVNIPPKAYPFFKIGRGLNEKLNPEL